MTAENYISVYATAKICGYNGSYDDFRKLYDRYYSEIISSISTKEPQLAKAVATNNPFRNLKHF